jgi:hypothetical protein
MRIKRGAETRIKFIDSPYAWEANMSRPPGPQSQRVKIKASPPRVKAMGKPRSNKSTREPKRSRVSQAGSIRHLLSFQTEGF